MQGYASVGRPDETGTPEGIRNCLQGFALALAILPYLPVPGVRDPAFLVDALVLPLIAFVAGLAVRPASSPAASASRQSDLFSGIDRFILAVVCALVVWKVAPVRSGLTLGPLLAGIVVLAVPVLLTFGARVFASPFACLRVALALQFAAAMLGPRFLWLGFLGFAVLGTGVRWRLASITAWVPLSGRFALASVGAGVAMIVVISLAAASGPGYGAGFARLAIGWAATAGIVAGMSAIADMSVARTLQAIGRYAPAVAIGWPGLLVLPAVAKAHPAVALLALSATAIAVVAHAHWPSLRWPSLRWPSGRRQKQSAPRVIQGLRVQIGAQAR